MDKRHLKVVVAHPGKQHSYRLAEALQQVGYLDRYITTVYDSKSSILMKLIKTVLRRQSRRRADSRSSNLIPSEKIRQYCELRGLILLAILRIDKSRVIYNWYNAYVAKSFGRKVASYAIKNNVDAVICYDTSAMFCFDILKKKAPNIVRIIDDAAMNRFGLCKIYQELDRTYGILKNKTGFKSYLLNEDESVIYCFSRLPPSTSSRP